ncbi:structural maintenance of chromosomes 2 [Arctopsyche grandis]|uniref:structural maintenance of chromosomes 2 n=1 Tax=Arctopsyche grandis TaxID=121162 RepID=UPI00406D980D
MYVKSIILDGFKSYGNRVEIKGFDREFNAITGLNGTGKSNILDSICFVLGITNLSHVRAGSLQDLVYKSGQAGITKASVTIMFDNSDKNQSPIGYDNQKDISITRQVVIGGKNKYLINGINVQNKRVTDLFCSVQLNVNNPHFLIMQGRITKVLNMKPPEILSMVEEAAGTKMYETKKQETQRTIEKKDAKLKELNDIIKEEISPKLSKLKEERSQYQEYQKVVRELENLVRLYVAWKYVAAEENSKNSKQLLEDVKNQIKEKQKKIVNNKKESQEIDKTIAEMSDRLDRESGGVLQVIEKELQEKEAIEAEIAAKTKSTQDNLKAHKSKHRLLENSIKDDEKAYISKKNQLDQMENSFGSLRSEMEEDAKLLTEAQDRFQAASSGLQVTESGQASLQDQLIAAKQSASEASTLISQHTMEKNHMTEKLKTLQKEASTSTLQYKKQQANIISIEKEVENLKNDLANIQYDENQLSEMQTRRNELVSSVRELCERSDILGSQLRRCNFQYKDPEPNFDRSKVKGLVCRLIKVKDQTYCMALEIAGGGKLYNVIVDTEQTSKGILKNGKLQYRTTMIPLNKIRGRQIELDKIRCAEQLVGPENGKTSLSLIEFDAYLKPAMEWVFGDSFVCPNLGICQKVAFHPKIQKRCITLDGDVVDPRGTLSGGSAIRGGSMLLRLEELKEVESQIEPIQNKLKKVECDIKSMRQTYDVYMNSKQKYERRHHELNAAKQQMQMTRGHQTHSEIEKLTSSIADLTKEIAELQKTHDESVKKGKELEERMKDLKGHRERQMKAVEDDLEKKKRKAKKSRDSWKNLEQDFETLKLEVSELQKSVDAGKEQLVAAEENLEQLSRQAEEFNTEWNRIKEIVKDIQLKIKEKKSEIAAKSREIKVITQKKEQLLASNSDIELEIKSLEHQIAKIQSDAASCEDKIKAMRNQYEWIASEREYFGEPGGLYDFKERDPRSAGHRISQLEQLKDKLGRNLNTRAQTLLGKEEEQHTAILQKKTKVENDRATLINTMKELDTTKRKAVIKACEQVNKDFGSIFSTLLPGAQAKLIPPEGMTVVDGLEVKVGFNGMWKEGLGELSGGQRSLVALSLILAMLLFHPAPLYILDEVDAALDLSHTQNIGNMLATHFKKSQFIIVSLKDGMFNNANVLFRTKFVDGMSTVQRTEQTNRR